MRNKKIFYVVSLILCILVLAEFSSAITAAIGNSRMILRVNPGDTIEKSILVRNTNDVPVTIDLFASGDLIDDLEIIDKQFVLDAGEEKKAYFKIEVKKEGKTETKINVRFTPAEGNGAGLSSTIIIFSGEGDNAETEESREEITEESDEGFSLSPSGNVVRENEESANNIVLISLVITALLFIILIVGLLYSRKKGDTIKLEDSVTGEDE